jgi:hypothetical protein
MDDKEEAPKLRIVYREAPGFRVIPVTGAQGGLTPQGLVYVSFFHDHVHRPDVVIRDQRTREENPEKGMGNQVPVVRTEEVAAIMSPEVADVIAKWLSGRAEQARQAMREREGAEKPGSKRER